MKCCQPVSKILNPFRQKKHVLEGDIVRECAPEVLIIMSMIQTIKPTVYLTMDKLHYKKRATSDGDSESSGASIPDESDDELQWSTSL